MPDEREVQEIKAGVEGMIDDVPSPSAELSQGPPMDDSSLPSTSYSDGSQEASPTSNNYNQNTQPNYGGSPQIDIDRVHEIIEAIINEKWQDIMGSVGNLAVWKEKTNNDLIAVKQELLRLEERFEQLQGAVLGKVKDYDEGIRGVHTEMKALEKVFEKILEPLTSNVKELNRITQEMKKIKH